MKRFATKVEKYLIRFIVLGMVALVLVQGMMTRDSWRLYLSWGERMEGQSIEFPVSSGKDDVGEVLDAAELNSPYALLSVSVEKFSSLPKAFVLVNGEKQKSFSSKDVKLQLTAGDVVEIDATFYDFPIEFRIKEVSPNMAFPEKDQVFTANDSIVMIGKIIVK